MTGTPKHTRKKVITLSERGAEAVAYVVKRDTGVRGRGHQVDRRRERRGAEDDHRTNTTTKLGLDRAKDKAIIESMSEVTLFQSRDLGFVRSVEN